MRRARKVGLGNLLQIRGTLQVVISLGWPCGRQPELSFPLHLPSGPLRSMVEDLQSEGSDEDDSSSGEESTVKTNPGRESRCVGSTVILGPRCCIGSPSVRLHR